MKKVDEAGTLLDAVEALEEVEAKPRRWDQHDTYQPSGIEWLEDIPSHWKARKLKFVADVRTSNVDKRSQEDETPVLLCNYVDVYKNDYITDAIEFMKATATDEQIARFTLKRGDVLITKDSEEWDDIAVPALVDQQLVNVVCGYHLALIRPREGMLHGGFLARAFESHAIRDQFRVRANGITRFGLSRDAVTSAAFPVPPLSEQRAIAAFLRRETAKIDALVEKKRRLIDLLKEKRTALISHAVTKGLNADVKMKPSGVEWLGDVPAHWTKGKLGFLGAMRGGSTPDKGNEAYWKGDLPWVSPKDMKTLVIHDSEDHVSRLALDETTLMLLQPPVVLIVVRGMILAHTFPAAITAAPVTINQDMKALTPGANLTPRYLLNLLNGIGRAVLGAVEESAHGTKILRTQVWKHIKLFLPDRNEQSAICDQIDEAQRQYDGLIRKVENAIDRLAEYRSALISAAVTGKIDVRDEVAP